MKNICFLSCDHLDGHVIDDNLAIQELEKNGEYKVSVIPWTIDTVWKNFDLVIIRTTWDYTQMPLEFIQKLEEISAQTKLINSVDVVKWNYNKGYLAQMERQGFPIVPTYFFHSSQKIEIPHNWNQSTFILKPAVSANAYQTMVVKRDEIQKQQLTEGEWLLQPFMEEIKHGEISLHFFDYKFSHGIMKVPKADDFRVQEEHGGTILKYDPDHKLIEMSERMLRSLPYEIFYARVDLLPLKDEFLLMELELIEPSLYFRTNSQSVTNFKKLLDKFFTAP